MPTAPAWDRHCWDRKGRCDSASIWASRVATRLVWADRAPASWSAGPDLVDRAVARASELGLEARGPLVLGVLRSLETYRPETLRHDSSVARQIASGLRERFGSARVLDLCMGPTISEEDALTIALEGRDEGAGDCALVPAEASCILGMILLEDHGIVTSNVAERPGARVSLRLRPTAAEVERFGGPDRVVDAVADGFGKLRMLLGDAEAADAKIFGNGRPR